jgi:hypothetical protein
MSREDVNNMVPVEIRKTMFGNVSSKFIGKAVRGETSPELELMRIKRTEEFWNKDANPLVDDRGAYHDPADCVNWLNETDKRCDNLLILSSLSLQGNPLFRKLFMNEEERNAPLITWTKDELDEHDVTIEVDLADFVRYFNAYKHKKLQRIENPKKLQLGFRVETDQGWTRFVIRYSEVHAIWRPKSEAEFSKELLAKWRKKAKGLEEVVDKYIGKIYKIGNDWAGILTFNLPELSTVCGGLQHAMPLPRDRYKIRWVHLPTIIRRKTETYSADKFNKLLEEGQFKETNGHEVIPKRFRGETTGGTSREPEEWEKMYPRRDRESSSS